MYGELRPEAGARIHAHVTAVSGIPASDGDKPDEPALGRQSASGGASGRPAPSKATGDGPGLEARRAPAAAEGGDTRRSPFARPSGIVGEGAAPSGDNWALQSGSGALAAGQAAAEPLRGASGGGREAAGTPGAAQHAEGGPRCPGTSPGPAGLRSREPAGGARGESVGSPMGGPSCYPALWHRAGWAVMGGRMFDRQLSALPAHSGPASSESGGIVRPPALRNPHAGARDEERGEAGADPGDRISLREGGAGALQSVAEDQGGADGMRTGGPGISGQRGAPAPGGRPQGAQLDTRPSFHSWDNPWE